VLAMGKETWRQFLVMAIFMNPAQGQLDGQPVELGRIITEQQRDYRVSGLGSVGRDRQGFLHAPAQSGSLFGQVRIQHIVELVLRVRLIVRQQRGKHATPLLSHTQLRQQLQGEVIHLKDGIGSPLKNAKQTQAIFGRQRRIGGIQRVAEDMTLFVFAIDCCARAVEMLP
jgi:hypothetical protein